MSIFKKLQDRRIRRRYGLGSTSIKCFVRIPNRIKRRSHLRHEQGIFLPEELAFISSEKPGTHFDFFTLREFEKHLMVILR